MCAKKNQLSSAIRNKPTPTYYNTIDDNVQETSII